MSNKIDFYNEENYCPWNFWEAVVAVFLTIPLILILTIPIAFLLERNMGEVIFSPSEISNFGFAIAYFIQAVVLLILLWLFVFYRNRATWYDLGIKPFSILKGIFLTLFGIIAIFFIDIVYTIFLRFIPWDTDKNKIRLLIENKNISLTMLFIVAVIIAPICEELFFRGFLFPAFKKKMTTFSAMFLSSILFAVFHLEPTQLIPLIGIGFILSFVYEKAESLIPSVLLHSLNNLIAIIILFQFIKYS